MKTPNPPKHLSADAKKLWRAIHQDYDIDQAASMILAATLEAYDRREQARLTLAKDGTTQIDRFGFSKPRPEVAIERDAAMTMMRGFRLLGFDQEARGDALRPRQ